MSVPVLSWKLKPFYINKISENHTGADRSQEYHIPCIKQC